MHIKFIQDLIDKFKYKFHIHSFKYGKTTRIMEPFYIDKFCEIGEYCYIGYYSNITKTKIGNYCSIGNFVVIGPGDHNFNRVSTSHYFVGHGFFEELTAKDCVIGNDVWIGTQSIIRRGVKIGNGAVIGANSFVNQDVPDFAIVAGSPAKIIKYRFDEETREKISKSEWWNLPVEEAKEKVCSLGAEIELDRNRTAVESSLPRRL